MSKRKNTKKTTKKLNKKSGIKNKPNPNKPYNININIDNSKKTGSRTQTQGGIKQTQGNPYPVYSKAVPMGGSTIVNNIPPPLQPQSNFNQQELTNIKKEILDRLNQPLTTPLLTHDPSFNEVRTDIQQIKEEHIKRKEQREIQRQIEQEEKEFLRRNQSMLFTGLTQNISRSNDELKQKIEQLNNMNALVPVNNKFDELKNHLDDFNRNIMLLPHSVHFQNMDARMENIDARMENIERNLVSSTPKLENQTEIKPQPQLQDNKNNNLMEDSYRKLKEKTADEFFNFSFEPNTKQPIAEPKIDKLAELPSEYFDTIVKKRKGKIRQNKFEESKPIYINAYTAYYNNPPTEMPQSFKTQHESFFTEIKTLESKKSLYDEYKKLYDDNINKINTYNTNLPNDGKKTKKTITFKNKTDFNSLGEIQKQIDKIKNNIK